MIDTSATEIKMLDMSRAYGIGADAVLSLLTHDPDRGYEVLVDAVDGGWTVELASINLPQTLILIEHDGIDSSTLLQVRAFAIDNIIYELISGYKIQSPEPSSPIREWQFPVAPTGELLNP